jgi:hypothetical protein
VSARCTQEVVSDPAAKIATRAIRELLSPQYITPAMRRPLPACVVSRRGESLAAWARRLKPPVDTIVPALAAIAKALAALHACGRVYHALKTSDIVWLEGLQEWVLADFGATVKAGARTLAAFISNSSLQT